MPKLHLIIDLATNRVVYFTEDLDARLTTDEHTAIAVFEGDIPKGMNLHNCFNYRYVNKELSNTIKEPAPVESLLEQNRKSISKFVNEKIEQKFAKLGLDKFQSEFYRCLLEELNHNPDGLRFIEQFQIENNMPSTDSTLSFIQNEMQQYRTQIIRLGILKLNWQTTVDNAKTSEELFDLRDRVFETLGQL